MAGRSQSPVMAVIGCFSLVMALACLVLAANDMSLSFAFGGLVAVVAAGILSVHPFFGVILYVVVIYLRPGDRWPELEKLRLTYVIGAGTFAIWMAQYLTRRRPTIVHHRVQFYLGALVLAAFLSWAPISLRSAVEVTTQGLFKAVAIYLLLANLTRTPNRLRWATWVVVVLSAVNALTAYLTLSSGAGKFEERASGVGVMDDPNDLALTLVMALPLAIALWQGDRGFYRRLLSAACAAALAFGVVNSRSRGGVLGLLAVLFLEGYERLPNRSLRAIWAVFGIAGGLVAFSALAAARGGSLGGLNEDANVYNRKGAWEAGLNMLRSKPLTGVGIYNFPEAVDAYGPDYLEQRNLNAHNSLVQVSGEMGLPGILAFGGLLLQAALSAARTRRLLATCQPTRSQLAISRALGRSLVGWFVCAFFLSQAYQFWLYILVGLIVAAEVIAKEAQPPPEVQVA